MVNMSLAGFEFFQIILPGISEKRLRLPAKFARELDVVALRDSKAKLQVVGAGQRPWEVDVVEDEHDGRAYLARGWRRFARAHDLQVGHFLVFCFDGASSFAVTVFDPSMCRRRFQHDAASASGTRKTRPALPPPTRPARADEAPPRFTVTLKPSNLQDMQDQYLNVPVEFAEGHGYAARKKVVLEMGGGSWSVNLKRGRGRAKGTRSTFRYGWNQFCVDNGLGVGDTCFFEALRDGAAAEHVLQVKVRTADGGAFLE